MDKLTAFIIAHRDDDITSLALQAARYPDIDIKYALTQIEGRQKAAKKLPEWACIDEIVYPVGISMEQCSSSVTAALKCQIIESLDIRHGTLVDLTGGFGVDFATIGRIFDTPVYVESNAALCRIASHNMPLLGLSAASIVAGTAEAYLEDMEHADMIYLDPARRDAHGRRTYAISDCTPDVVDMHDTLVRKADYVMVKLSPMLDWHEVCRQLAACRSVYIVSVKNECKELLVLMSMSDESRPFSLHCINDDTVYTISDIANDTDKVMLSTDITTARYLYEPNASVMKSGCFGALCMDYGVCQIGRNSHLYVSSRLSPSFPGRAFAIESVIPFGDKRITQMGRANVAVRNFPMSVADIRKRFKIRDGGENYVFATTDAENKHWFICCRKC
jgi:16S rRNA G966 N2-methylase RsmD